MFQPCSRGLPILRYNPTLQCCHTPKLLVNIFTLSQIYCNPNVFTIKIYYNRTIIAEARGKTLSYPPKFSGLGILTRSLLSPSSTLSSSRFCTQDSILCALYAYLFYAIMGCIVFLQVAKFVIVIVILCVFIMGCIVFLQVTKIINVILYVCPYHIMGCIVFRSYMSS